MSLFRPSKNELLEQIEQLKAEVEDKSAKIRYLKGSSTEPSLKPCTSDTEELLDTVLPQLQQDYLELHKVSKEIATQFKQLQDTRTIELQSFEKRSSVSDTDDDMIDVMIPLCVRSDGRWRTEADGNYDKDTNLSYTISDLESAKKSIATYWIKLRVPKSLEQTITMTPTTGAADNEI